jgi:hypothetical protein
LEQEVLSLGYSRILFDENLQPRLKLLQLLEVLGMEKECATTAVKINEWAQKSLLRNGERFHEQSKTFEPLRDKIKPLLSDLGFIEGSSAHFKEYQGALLLGALLGAVRTRLHFLIEQWKSGVRFSDLYFLGGQRPLVKDVENVDTFRTTDGPLQLRQDWAEPSVWPTTESEMMQLVYEQADMPQEMRKQVKVHHIVSPLKTNPVTGELARPNTDDTVRSWLAATPPPGRYLTVSNAPYIARQDVVIRTIATDDYRFDAIGKRAREDQQMAIILDELARLIFQSILFSKSKQVTASN